MCNTVILLRMFSTAP